MVRYLIAFVMVWLGVYLSFEGWRVSSKQQKLDFFWTAMRAFAITVVAATVVCAIVLLF